MPKPTSTALNVNDNFSDRDVNPQHGDADSQDEVTLKSDIPNAGAAPPSRLADVGAADYTEEAVSSLPSNITVSIDGSGNVSCSPGPNVKSQGTVTLKSSDGVPRYVCTYTSTSANPAMVFTTGSPPYLVNGTTYTLAEGTTGGITFRLTASASCPIYTGLGANGNINVGGGSGGKGGAGSTGGGGLSPL